VTHDQAEGLGVADRVTVLREGRIEHSGTVESVVKTPSTEFTARFVGKHAVIDGEAHGGRVKTPLGEFPCGAGHAGPVRAAFRPSQVRIGSGALDATVLHATYEPGGWLHRLEAAGTVLHAVSEALHPAGSRVTLELRGEPWLFPVKS
jgi:ABC-type Fe3+/spermidine/putrescine transport system ATPase subunit